MANSNRTLWMEGELLKLIDAVTEYAIYVLDRNGRVQSWNRGAEAIKGYCASEVIGKHYAMFFRESDRQEGLPDWQLQRALIHGKIQEEGWRVRKDGSAFWANVVITPIFGADGTVQGFAKVTRDISDRVKLHELEHTLKGRNAFLAMLGHELRGPLAPMRNAVSILQLDDSISTNVKVVSDILDRQISHLTRLVDDLLDAGRLTSGKLQVNPEMVDFSIVLRKAIECVQPTLDVKRQVLRVDIPERIIFVNADAVRLIQVIQNLLANASKFSFEGDAIEIKAEIVDGWIRVAVSDSGVGMDPATINDLFVMFAQGPASRKSDKGGLGIGLALARSIVEMHGGRISGSSVGVGSGSTFTFELPGAVLREGRNTSEVPFTRSN